MALAGHSLLPRLSLGVVGALVLCCLALCCIDFVSSPHEAENMQTSSPYLFSVPILLIQNYVKIIRNTKIQSRNRVLAQTWWSQILLETNFQNFK